MASPQPLNVEGPPKPDIQDRGSSAVGVSSAAFASYMIEQDSSRMHTATFIQDLEPWLPRPLTPYLESIQATSRWRFTFFGGLSGFLCYLCVYFFRKAWQVYEFDAEWGLGGLMKDAFLVAQLTGIWLAKIYGWKFNAEVQRGRVTQYLIACVTFAELTLVLLALLPEDLKPVAMFLNGLPLGLVWGLIVAILEGRESSDAMLVTLACSFVLGSGMAKDAGNVVLGWNVPPYWMPAVTGLLAYPVFLFATWLLYQVPAPLASEQQVRTKRKAMFSNEREFFFFTQWPGLICLWLAFLPVVAVREYRDAYSVQIFEALQVDPGNVSYASAETVVAFVVIGSVGLVGLIKDNRRAVQLTMIIMALGSIFLLATVFLGHERLGVFPWMTCLGIGSYMSYVAYNSVLFERLIAFTKIDSTVAYPMVISDSGGFFAALLVAIATLFDTEGSTTDVVSVISTMSMVCGFITLVAWGLAALYYLNVFQAAQQAKRGSRRRPRKSARDARSRARSAIAEEDEGAESTALAAEGQARAEAA